MTGRPKILHACAVDFTVAHFLLPLMKAQQAWGFEVHFTCSPGEFVDSIVKQGFQFHSLPVHRGTNPGRHIKTYLSMRRLMRDEELTVAHLHTPVAAMIGRPAARKSGVPIVLYTAHGFYFHEGMPAWKRRAHIALERFAQRSADFLMTQSGEDARTAIREGIAPRERLAAIGNGVDITRFSPAGSSSERQKIRDEWGLPAEAPVVLMMGRLVKEKGYPELLTAWSEVRREVPSAILMCAGPELKTDRDGYGDDASKTVRELGIESSVRFLGFRNDVDSLMLAADLFVLPSRREGMPRSILEAMASGLPVIASDIRGCREEVVDGETGLLVPVANPETLATAITRLLKNPEERRAMSRAGHVRARKNFNEVDVIQRQQAIYQRLFEEKGLPWPG